MKEFALRREQLFSRMKENSVAIIFSGVSKIQSEDEYYDFCVNKNFFYLTNIEQENSILVLIKAYGEKKEYLFIDEYDEIKEKWTGRRITNVEASNLSSIQNIYASSSFDEMVKLFLQKEDNQYGPIDTLYLDLSEELKIRPSYSTIEYSKFINNEYSHINVENIYPSFVLLRSIKSEFEVANMTQAIQATSQGIAQILINIKPGMVEHELSDIFEYYGKINGYSKLAFSTICASGKNATCLHYPYRQQNDKISDNCLVLFDLGYSYKGYSADISRTYPITGVFEGKQRDVYESVLNTNKAVIEYVRAGMTIKDLQEFTREYLKKECVRHGLLKDEDDITRVYYHNISHHLGLDTHDVSNREKPLEDGNVITVEPGLYFADLGIGVRIEDDVLISDGKGECLSTCIPKEIHDIEKIFRSKAKLPL